MRVLVTGGAGFIGSHLVERLVGNEHEVLALDNLASGSLNNLPTGADFSLVDITDDRALRAAFRRFKPQAVSHQAAQTQVVTSCLDPRHDAAVNILGTINVLAAAIENGCRTVVFASSGGTVYGVPSRQPVSEEEPLRPISPYGVSKVAGEHYVRVLCSSNGLRYVILRYGNVYGPRDVPTSQHVITAFVTALANRERPVIEWDGEQRKDYVYIGDVVDANLLALQSGGEACLNIGSGESVTVNRLFEMICALTGSVVEPVRRERRPNDVRCFTLDCSRAQRVVGWSARTPLIEGLATTVDYYLGRHADGKGGSLPDVSVRGVSP